MGDAAAIAMVAALAGALIVGTGALLLRARRGTHDTAARLRALGLEVTGPFAARGVRSGVDVVVAFGQSTETIGIRATIPIDLWLGVRIAMSAFSRAAPRVDGVEPDLARAIAGDPEVASLLLQATTFGETLIEDDVVSLRVEMFAGARLQDAIDCAAELAHALARARWRLRGDEPSLDTLWTDLAATLGARCAEDHARPRGRDAGARGVAPRTARGRDARPGLGPRGPHRARAERRDPRRAGRPVAPDRRRPRALARALALRRRRTVRLVARAVGGRRRSGGVAPSSARHRGRGSRGSPRDRGARTVSLIAVPTQDAVGRRVDSTSSRAVDIRSSSSAGAWAQTSSTPPSPHGRTYLRCQNSSSSTT